jgi:hypothetical protein
MSAGAFDRHIYIKKFTAKGMSEELAEEVTDAIKASKDTDFSHLATKVDLRELEMRMDVKIAQLETKIAQSTATITKWITVVLVVQVLMPLIQNILPLLKH